MKPLRLARVILPALLLLALLLLASTCTEWNDMPQAPCRGGARIFGVVTGGSGPISGVGVLVQATNWEARLETETEADGTYEILVPPGKYFVSIDPPRSNSIFFSADGAVRGWYDADTLQFSAGDEDARADFRLGGLLLLMRVPPGYEEPESYYDSGIGCALEDPAGQGTYGDLRGAISDSFFVFDCPTIIPGTYVLRISRGSNQSMWFPATLDREQAELIEIKSDETVFRTARFYETARARGRITGAWTLIEDEWPTMYLSLYGPDSTAAISEGYVARDFSFDLPVLAGGEVRVRLGTYWVESWIGGGSFRDANLYSITPGETVDLGEIPTCGIRCTLIEWPGSEAGSWRAYAFDEQGSGLGFTHGDAGSDCLILLARPTTCRVRILRNQSEIWREQWYDRQIDLEHATPVTVSGPGELAEISIRLEKGGSISGHAIYEDGSPASDVWIQVRSGEAVTDEVRDLESDGAFSISGLPDGELQLRAIVDKRYYYYYPGTAFPDSSELIPIVDASDVTGLVFRLPTIGGSSPLFVGATLCKPCHQTESQGQIYAIWAASAHSRAFSDLGPTQQQDDLCLSCHTTGFGRELAPGRDRTSMRGVQCEACHGPGSEYKAMSVMRDPMEAARLGLITPDEDDCRVCHRGSLPRECWGGGGTSPAFDYSLASARIAHRIPG